MIYLIPLLVAFSYQFNFCKPNFNLEPQPDGYSLIHSIIIFKHGHHAPIDKIPEKEIIWNCSSDNYLFPGGNPLNDDLVFTPQFKIKPIPEQSFLLGSCRAGELLEEGISQIVNLADFLKQKVYSSFFPSKFNRRFISFRSTYTNRCMASIQVLAHHLFPGIDPIDVFVANEELESLIPNTYLCPTLNSIYESVNQKNTTFMKKLSEYHKKLKKIKDESQITAVPHWLRMAEYLSTLKCSNISYPGTFTDNFLQQSSNILLDFFNEVTNYSTNPNGIKYCSGILFSEIYLGMRDFLSGRTDTKVIFICGHTLTFISLMSSLNLTLEWIPCASYLSFDLLVKNESNKLNSQMIVLVHLNGRKVAQFDFKEFEKKALELRPTEKECNITYPFIEKDKKSQSTKFLLMSFS